MIIYLTPKFRHRTLIHDYGDSLLNPQTPRQRTQTLIFDNADRLTTLANDFVGSSDDLSVDFTYNPANQIATATRAPDSYAFAPTATDTSDTINGLNQIMMNGLTSATWQWMRR